MRQHVIREPYQCTEEDSLNGDSPYVLPKDDSMTEKQSDQYGKAESEQRFRKLVGIALGTKPTTQKAMGHKGVAAQRKKPIKKVRRKGEAE
jgi:hypothetical protein